MTRYELEGRVIVYLDESGYEEDMPRTHGYSLRGERCYNTKDWHNKGRANAIGAIIRFLFLTVCLFNENINLDVFYAWITQDLIPKLPPNAVIVMDNATFHKRKDIIQAIEKAGHTPEFLPSYSPNLNPIEHKWAQAKAKRRKERCDVMELFQKPNLCNFIVV